MITVIEVVLKLSLAGSGRRIGDGSADQAVGRIVGAGIGQVVDRIDDLRDRAGVVGDTLIGQSSVRIFLFDITVLIVSIGDIITVAVISDGFITVWDTIRKSINCFLLYNNHLFPRIQ